MAHFGNWELLGRACARRGMRFGVIVRTLRGRFNRALTSWREEIGMGLLSDRGSTNDALRRLRSGETLAVVVDQNMRASRGVFVSFFGTLASTTAAAAGIVSSPASEACCLNWGGRPRPKPQRWGATKEPEGTLLAGAAEVGRQPPYPVVKAGYAPPRPEVTAAAHPLRARALVLQVGGLRVGIASLDVLLIPDSLTSEVVTGLQDLRFAQLWISGTHTHSSLGGFDPRPISEMAGMGRYQQAVEQSVVHAAASALRAAAAAMVPAEMQAGEGRFPSLVMAQSQGAEPAGRLTPPSFFRHRAPPPHLCTLS